MIHTSITAGPMATAASVLGAAAPTLRPSAAAVKDSRVKMPRNLANLIQHQKRRATKETSDEQ